MADRGMGGHEPLPEPIPGEPEVHTLSSKKEETAIAVTSEPPTPSLHGISVAAEELQSEGHIDTTPPSGQVNTEEETQHSEDEKQDINEKGEEVGGDADEDSDSSDSDKSDDSDEDEESKKKRLEVEKESLAKAENLFNRKSGVVYAPEEFFTEMSPWARHCHIYVSVNSDEKLVEGQKKTTAPASDSAAQNDKSAVSTADQQTVKTLGAKDTPSSVLPTRITVINDVLASDLSGICSTMGSFSYHLAPFRGLVYHEKEIRERHLKLEEEFIVLSEENANHEAVVRKKGFLHHYFAHGIKVFPAPSSCDDIDKARALLDGYRALVQCIKTDLGQLVETCQKIRDVAVEALPFSHLWYLFALHPTVPVVVGNQAYRVLRIRGGRATAGDRKADENFDRLGGSKTRWAMSDLEIDCFSIDYDGKEFGPVANQIRIRQYEGVRKIRNLEVYPASFNADRVTITDALYRRGKIFEKMTKEIHWQYRGLSLREPGKFEVREEIDSDVMIDLELAYRTEAKISAPEFGGSVITDPTSEEEQRGRDPDSSTYSFEAYLNLGSLWDDVVNPELLQNQPPGSLSKEAYMILPGRIYGYVLFSRKWYPLSVDLITTVPPIKPGESDGFKKLVLPKGHKDIVRALVKTHTRKLHVDGGVFMAGPQREFDLVKGKGRGLIILLHGAPGVGKTSTAECVAANAGRPLFHITCGDISGDSAQEVEANLDHFFDLAAKWNCVLLLDEADVFLSSRQLGNLRQNSLVSVFLRVLEYYPGILILTTNRVGNFDEAIKSRVHCALYYPPLDKDQTFKVWSRNLRALKERNDEVGKEFRIRFSPAEIKRFAEWHWKDCESHERWNGRQIKNAFQTAVALAEWRMLKQNDSGGSVMAPDLKWEDFEKVANSSKHFDMYLKTVRPVDDVRARVDELRNDRVSIDIPGRDGDRTTKSSVKPKVIGRKQSASKKKGRRKMSEVDETDEEDSEEDEDDTDEEEGESEDETDQDSFESEDEPSTKKRSKGRTTSRKMRRQKKVEKEEPESEALEDWDSGSSDDEDSSEDEDLGVVTPPQSTKKVRKATARVDKKRKSKSND